MSKKRFTEDSWRRDGWFQAVVAAFQKCAGDQTMLENFLRDIATLSELQAFSERLEVAKMLSQGISYRDIAAKTGASTTTVTRVAKFLENGEGGYRFVLNAHRHHRMGAEVMKNPVQPSSVSAPKTSSSLLQKYLEKQKEGQNKNPV